MSISWQSSLASEIGRGKLGVAGDLGTLFRCPEGTRLAPDARPPVVADVGADLLTMCQRNIALNSHLTAAGGEARRVGGRSVWQVGPAP